MSKLHIKKGDMVLVIAGKDNYKITGKDDDLVTFSNM